jgi:hypothetical protein
MDIGDVMNALLRCESCYRMDWYPGSRIYLRAGFIMHNFRGAEDVWRPESADLLSDDWRILNDEEDE